MRITQATVEANRATLQTDMGALVLEARTDAIVRVTLYKEHAPQSPLGIPAAGEAAPHWASREEAHALHLSLDRLVVTVDKATGRLSWREPCGRPLVTQPAPEVTPQPVVRFSAKNASVRKVRTIDGERSFVENLERYEDRVANKVKLFFDWVEDEGVYGLGQGEEGIWNYRGHTQYLYQNNMRIPIPFFLSDRGYGLLVDTGSLMTFGDDSRGSYLLLDTVDALDYYFIQGANPDRIIAGFRSLTGAAALLPKWAYGYIQSKEAYRTQDEMVEVAKEYRRRRIPLDCVVQDWNTWAPGLWGNKRVDKARYPDLKAMNDTLHAMNVHSMVSVWPNMNEGGDDFEEFKAAGKLLGDFSTYDAFDEEARAIYWQQADRELFSGGFDSWWCDSTEPFCGPDWGGPVRREPWERYNLVGGELKKFLDPAHANLYALHHAKGIYENQRRTDETRRVLNLTRSGSAGSQRYGAVLWSGDISATWDTLRRQIAEGLNMCMSGMPWWTLDIGGFFTVREKWQNRGCGASGNPEPLWFWQGDFEDGVADPGYRELYVRWLQMGCFLPMFRSHGTDTPREIWQFGEPGTPYYDAIEKYIRLRYTLLPTIYSLAGRVALEGYTMLRSLVFDFGHDPVARAVGDQFMMGDALLVCPVTEPQFHAPGGEGRDVPAFRRCYLPAGAAWYDYWTGASWEGGRWVTVATPLDIIPLFVRAGSILVMETAELEHTGQQTAEPLELRVWPGADGAFTLYEDSGDGYGYEQGLCNRIAIRWKDVDRTLTVGGSEHIFPGSLNGRRCVIRVGDDTAELAYSGEPITIRL